MRFKGPEKHTRDKVGFALLPVRCSSDYGTVWLERFVKTQKFVYAKPSNRLFPWSLGFWLTECITPYSEYKKMFPNSDL